MMNMGAVPGQMPPQMPMMQPPPPQPVDPEKLVAAQTLLRKPTWDDVIGLFRDDRLRSFKIDIETDSTIAADEISEKQSVTEFVTMLGQLLTQAMPLIQQAPELAPLIMETIKYATRRFKAGRQMETIIDETTDRILQKIAKTAGQAAPIDPKVQAAQMLAQAKIQQSQVELQIAEKRSDAEVELKHQEASANMGLRQAQAAGDLQLEIGKATNQAQIAALKAIHQPAAGM